MFANYPSNYLILVRPFLLSLCAAISISAPALAQTPPQNVPATATPPLLQPYAPIGGPKITLQNSVYRVENISPGSFGVAWKLSQPDAAKIARLSFEWKPSGDVKVNFFFKVAGKYYAVILSGDEYVRAGTKVLGKATTTNLPDGFQRVEMPLRAWLLGANPNAKSLPIEEVLLGNWRNDGYLLAGIGGNGVGANYQLRSVKIRDVSESKLAPEVKTPTMENNDVLWPITDFAGIETGTLKLNVAGQTYGLNSPHLRLESKIVGDNLTQTLHFAAGDAGITLNDGQTLPLTLEGLKDSSGRLATGTTDGTITSGVRFVASAFKAQPPLPRLEIEGSSLQNEGDFETSNAGFVAGSSIIERSSAPDRFGSALKLTNPKTATRFDTLITTKIDVAQFPAFVFDYRCDDRVRLNFRFRWDEVDYSIRFLDRDSFPKDSRVVSLQPIDNPKADSNWNTATYNLLEALKKARPEATKFEIGNLILSDDNWMGNARGVSIWLDNFRFVPTVPKTFKPTVVLRDVTGIANVSFLFDQSQNSRVDEFAEKSSGPPAQIEIPQGERAAGLWYLHVRAKNNTGSWSETSHFPVLLAE